jgi:AbrB family looped-hinge helix DNA binding protein
MTPIVETAKVMAKGQITIPKEIRQRLGVGDGDRVTLIWDGDQVVMVNPTLFAMRVLQDRFAGQAAQAGFQTEDDVAAYVNAMRHEGTVA